MDAPEVKDQVKDKAEGKCPVAHGGRTRSNRDWWPEQLDLQVLHRNSDLSNPMG